MLFETRTENKKDQEYWGGAATLNQMVRVSLIENLTLEQELEGGERVCTEYPGRVTSQ